MKVPDKLRVVEFLYFSWEGVRADMLTSPVAAARAAVATGEWVKSKHDMYVTRGSVGA